MLNPIDEATIMLYLDGELDPESAQEVRQAIDASPELQRIERELRELLGDVTLAFSAWPDPAAARVAAPAPVQPAPVVTSDNVVSIDRARTTKAPKPSVWSSNWMKAAAALALVLSGASASWWVFGRSDSVSGQQVASDIDALLDTVDGDRRGSATRRPSSRPRSDGARVATGPENPKSGTRPPESIPSGPVGDAGYARVTEIRIPGTRVVAASDQENGTSGERTLEYLGSRLLLTFTSRTSSDDVVLTSSELAMLATASTVDSTSVRPNVARAFQSLARTSNGTRSPAATAACESPIRIRHATGVVVTLQGKRPCSELAKLAQSIEMTAGR